MCMQGSQSRIDLPPELLLEVSGRLQHAADVVRFYAVCRSWRDAAPASGRPSVRPPHMPAVGSHFVRGPDRALRRGLPLLP